jgi:hypothetical protein
MDGAHPVGEPVTARALRLGLALLLLSAMTRPPLADEIVPPPSRDVTPPGFTPAPKVTGPLFREPVPPPPPPPPRWHRFFLPVTTNSGTFRMHNQTIAISGIAPPPAGETCRLDENEEWPCGRTALHALRMFLRGRAVECFFPKVAEADKIIAPCRVGRTDLGLWLLSEGWARPDERATEAYRNASRAARCARLGLWRGAVPDHLCRES